NKLFGNFTLTYSKYHYDLYSKETGYNETYQSRYYSGIKDISGKIDFDFAPNPKHQIKSGLYAIFHTFTPGILSSKTEDILLNEEFYSGNRTYSNEYHTYFEDNIKINNYLSVNLGLHSSLYTVNGKNYHSIQPRISTNLIIKGIAVKGSYASMQQNIHLLTSSGAGLPEDLWVPATENVKPQNSKQAALGIAKTFKNNYEFSIESYYKKMDDLIEFAEGASFSNFEENWQNKLVTGKGKSYGIEFFFRKKQGSTFGWIGYTLSWSNRQFNQLNFGKEYPYKYDRRHDFKIALTHNLYKKLSFSCSWVYGTGNAVTLPVAKYNSPNNSDNIIYFGARNSFRMQAYHRLDIALKCYFKKIHQKEYSLTLGVFNAYNRQNPYYIYFKEKNNGKLEARQVTVFPIIPFLSFTFTF
ncbi:MAG: TonB-dependent receptor, partial [Calditrichia bacterium]|nr:TonB-dependent receptor [Calditrichia bacterium]